MMLANLLEIQKPSNIRKFNQKLAEVIQVCL